MRQTSLALAAYVVSKKRKQILTIEYRREIDGLRALAVVPVILFHAGFSAFWGGFVGVDVFFVISGFLITSIILEEKKTGTFNLINFYERRARRILPALFVVMFACLPFAWLWLLPQDMKSFSQSLVAVSAFASNVLFWRTSGYFETAAELKPLLHTWSLAVEEQYYVLFPIFLMFTWRLGNRLIFAMLAVAAFISLALAHWGSVARPEATFFLLPTRGWELLMGAFMAPYFQGKGRANISQSVSQLASAFGLFLILLSVFAFDNQTPFPSLYALTPTLGAALIILFATQQTVVGKLLGCKLFVGMGLISYSAYLWHQPLFAFARHRSIEEPSKSLLGALGVAAVVLAYITWKFVETPFRNKRNFSRGKIFAIAVFGSAFFASVGISGYLTNGFDGRLSAEQKVFLSYFENDIPEWKYFMRMDMFHTYRAQCDFYDLGKYRSGYSTKIPIENISDECFVRDNSLKNAVLVWGDSHAQQFYPGLKKALPSNWQILQVASSGCAAKLNGKPNKEDYCDFSNWFAYKTIVETRPDVVVVGQNLNHSYSNMMLISQHLKSIGVKKVVFTGPTPHWITDLPKLVAQRFFDDTPRRTFAGIDKKISKLDMKLKADFAQSNSANFVSVMDYFCNEGGCLVYIGDDRRDGITTWDYGHLSPVASYHFARDVLVKEIVTKSK